MTGAFTFADFDRTMTALMRHRGRTEPTTHIDFLCQPHVAVGVKKMFEEYLLDKEWNDRHRAIWWAGLTPEQQVREKRVDDRRFKLSCQWSRKPLPLPGTAGFSVFYQDSHRDEYGDLIPKKE